jgi:hypothetical protein
MTDKLYCPRAAENGGGPNSPFKAPMNGEMTWREDRTCSYCGSIDPEDFLKAMAEGQLITPTDKSYKAYADIPGRSFTKFYFQHLDEAQRERFIELVNARRVNWAAPGHLYVMPFFCKAVEPGS